MPDDPGDMPCAREKAGTQINCGHQTPVAGRDRLVLALPSLLCLGIIARLQQLLKAAVQAPAPHQQGYAARTHGEYLFPALK